MHSSFYLLLIRVCCWANMLWWLIKLEPHCSHIRPAFYIINLCGSPSFTLGKAPLPLWTVRQSGYYDGVSQYKVITLTIGWSMAWLQKELSFDCGLWLGCLLYSFYSLVRSSPVFSLLSSFMMHYLSTSYLMEAISFHCRQDSNMPVTCKLVSCFKSHPKSIRWYCFSFVSSHCTVKSS